jgi:predicted component of type VI protein secretion system
MKNTAITPCFLDRFDVNRYIMTPSLYRKTILRDIANILNSFSHLTQNDIGNEGYKYVKSSVLAFGLDSFAGQDRGQIKNSLINDIKNALYMFEPRLKKESISVTEEQVYASGEIYIRISGKLFAALCDGKQIDLTLSFDIETGQLSVKK